MKPLHRLIVPSLLVLVLGLGAPPARASLTVVPQGTQMDTNFPGNDFRSFPSDDVNGCAEVCERTRGCMAWTWVRPGVQGPRGMCWLKNGAPQVVKDRCCMSGLRIPTGRPEPGINRPGQDYRNFALPRPATSLCETACYDDRRCRSWTYVNANPAARTPAHCWLKQGVPNPVADPCCTSGTSKR